MPGGGGGEIEWWFRTGFFLASLEALSEPFDLAEEEQALLGDGSRAQRSLMVLDLVIPLDLDCPSCLKRSVVAAEVDGVEVEEWWTMRGVAGVVPEVVSMTVGVLRSI